MSTDSLIQMGVFIVINPVDRIILNKSQTDSLFSILYNYKPLDPGGNSTDCYEPRHAIVFYQNNRATAFIEICFECNRTIRTHGIDFGLFCSDKYSMLRNFFWFIGVQHVSGSSFQNSGGGIEK
ncbi:MAG TPA: hypothetical protein VGO45_08610 [Bacteroidia bacterium]|nr:hypothetical protein [Bacteroidia bacterium]